MPVQEISHRRQWALCWARNGSDAHGAPTVSSTSVELLVRWTDNQRDMLDPNGDKIRVDATLIMDRETRIGSIFWKGDLEDLAAALPGTGSADSSDVPPSGLFQAVAVDDAKDVKGRAAQRTVGLMRWGDALPTRA